MPVLDEVAAGAFDDAGGDGPALGEGAGVVQVGFLGLQVGQGPGDDLVVLAAGPGRAGRGQVLDPGDHLCRPAVQDGQALGGDPVLGGGIAGPGQQLGGPLVVVWDGLNTHVSSAMCELVAARSWLTVFRLPPYASELNPVNRSGRT
jgi:DDE superfamily endonuclease